MTELDGSASRPSTREAVIRTAERLFGEHGIDAVSLRQIAAAAGQRNNSVVSYQFGSRQGLVDAIFDHRMARIDERRRAMLAAPGGAGDLRALLEAFVYPLAESIGHEEGVSWYARFLRQVVFRPGFDVFSAHRAEATRGLRTVVDGLNRHLGHLPEPVRNRRLLQVSQMIVHSLADHEAALAHGARSPATSFLAADLVDCAESVLLAPVSADTSRELSLLRRKEA